MHKTNMSGTPRERINITMDQPTRRSEMALFNNRRGRKARIAFMHVTMTTKLLFSWKVPPTNEAELSTALNRTMAKSSLFQASDLGHKKYGS
jgi:hypothetical protein